MQAVGNLSMSNYKNQNHDAAPNYRDRLSVPSDKADGETAGVPLSSRGRNLVAPDGKNIGGWEAYRRWLTRVQAPQSRRGALDPKLYTWKGYRSWAEQVRRDWKTEE